MVAHCVDDREKRPVAGNRKQGDFGQARTRRDKSISRIGQHPAQAFAKQRVRLKQAELAHRAPETCLAWRSGLGRFGCTCRWQERRPIQEGLQNRKLLRITKTFRQKSEIHQLTLPKECSALDPRRQFFLPQSKQKIYLVYCKTRKGRICGQKSELSYVDIEILHCYGKHLVLEQ